jgi:hypothetical protein
MKIYTLITILGLLTSNVIAQANNQDANIASFIASELPYTSSEAQALKETITAQATFTPTEADFLNRWILANTNESNYNEAICGVILQEGWENKNPVYGAHIKAYNKDSTGWTQDMIESDGGSYASWVAILPTASGDFKKDVFDYITKRSVGWDANQRAFFKDYRKSLSKEEQIAVTQQQKDLTIAMPERTEVLNAWLVEMSADLMALQLNK